MSTTPGQSVTVSDGNKGVLRIYQTYIITGSSTLDASELYQGP